MNHLQIVINANDFINKKIRYIPDKKLWKKKDYWATPKETLSKGAGDCEDFVIAKYFMLIDSGIPDDHLRLVYVKTIKNEAHMVLCYQHQNDRLVLDNLNKKILPVSQRKDLFPVYSFNLTGVWVGFSEWIGKPSKIKLWQNLLDRM